MILHETLAQFAASFYEPNVFWNLFIGVLAGATAGLGLWQWAAARRFPLHRVNSTTSPTPSVSVLKPLKGCDEFTERCLRSWFQQEYPGDVQLLFGVTSEADPVCDIVRSLLKDYPDADATLVMCPENLGANAKVSSLVQLQRQAKHSISVVSDADVLIPPGLLANAVHPLDKEKVGLVSCFYRQANPTTTAMRWEALAVNADFWSQVLQCNTLQPMDFALGAVMVVRREALEAVDGFEALANCLADDYQLGNRIVRKGYQADLCTVVVECWDPPQGWGTVWRHQLRWARTIRVCQPVPYFFSILNNATLWPLLWVAVAPSLVSLIGAGCFLLLRIVLALDLQRLFTPGRSHLGSLWLVPVKDLLQAAVWLISFLGNTVNWRGRRMRLRRDGTLRLEVG